MQPAASRCALPGCCRERPWSSHSLRTLGTCSLSPGLAGRLRAPGRGRGTVLGNRAKIMGRAAAAGEGAGGARRWLPWLGLCFWAAGAAAARGKRWAERAAGLGARREGAGQTERDPHLPRWLPKLSPAPLRAPSPAGWESGGGPQRGPLLPTPSLRPGVILQVAVTGPLPLTLPARSISQALPNCCRLEYPPFCLQSRCPPFSPLPSKARSLLGGRPSWCPRVPGKRGLVTGVSVGWAWRGHLFPPGSSARAEVR